MTETKRYLVAGEWKSGSETFEVKSPYDDSLVATVAKPTKNDVEAAVQAASDSFEVARKLPVHARAEALMHISSRLKERGEEIAEMICKEGGKPMKWATVERLAQYRPSGGRRRSVGRSLGS